MDKDEQIKALADLIAQTKKVEHKLKAEIETLKRVNNILSAEMIKLKQENIALLNGFQKKFS